MRTKNPQFTGEKPSPWQFFTTVRGLLLAGLIAAGAMYAVHHFLIRQKVESAMLDLVESKRRAVDGILGEMKSEAFRLSNMEVPKNALADYRADKGGLEELRAASVPVFEAEIKKSGELLGVARCSTAGGAIVEAGEKVPRERRLLPTVGDGDPVVHGPFQFENEQRVIVGVPVLAGDVSEGTDVVLFSLSGLLSLVTDYSGMGEKGEVILGASRGKITELFFPLRGDGETSEGDAMIGEALGRTMRGESGTVTGENEKGEAVMIGFTPLLEADWGLLIRVPGGENSVGEARHRSPTSLVFSGFAFMGTVGILFFLRPHKSKRSFSRDF